MKQRFIVDGFSDREKNIKKDTDDSKFKKIAIAVIKCRDKGQGTIPHFLFKMAQEALE